MAPMMEMQKKFGRSCTRCKMYFVTDNQTNYLCPWCERIEAGKMGEEVFVSDDSLDL
jgi:predicted RNA-binding Zn-ribbon protein involved in translation (DUF1610 family)